MAGPFRAPDQPPYAWSPKLASYRRTREEGLSLCRASHRATVLTPRATASLGKAECQPCQKNMICFQLEPEADACEWFWRSLR